MTSLRPQLISSKIDVQRLQSVYYVSELTNPDLYNRIITDQGALPQGVFIVLEDLNGESETKLIVKGKDLWSTAVLVNSAQSGGGGETGSSINITLNLSSPALATVANKYNKNKIVMVQYDDANPDAPLALADAQTIDLDDGCGGVVHPRFSTAVNGHNPFLEVNGEPQEWGTNSSRLLYEQFPELIEAGIDVEDHSDFHLEVPNLQAAIEDINTNRQLWFDRIGYLMCSAVAPTNFPHFVQAWKNLNYFTAITQNAKDGLPIYPVNAWDNYGNLTTIPEGFAQLNRTLTETWDIAPRNKVDAINAASNASNTLFFVIGTHTYNQAGWLAFLEHLDSGFLMASAREVFEYKWLKDNSSSFITQVQDGNQLTITYDLTKLPSQIRWRDLTFKLPDGVTISSMEVEGADSFNFQGGLCNVFKEKLNWTQADVALDPIVVPDTEDPTAPSNLVEVSKTNNSVTIAWDESTDNKEVAGYNVYVNNVLNKTESGLETTITGLEAETSYNIKVSAFDDADNESGFSNEISVTTESATSYTVERTFQLDLRNPNFQVAPAGWNGIGGNNADVQNGNSYVSGNLVAVGGASSTLNVTIPVGFDGGANNSANTFTGETGVAPDAVLNTAFLTTSTSVTSVLRVNNLQADKFYQVYMLGTTASANANARFGVTGYGTVDKVLTNNKGTNAGAMLEDTAWAVINNVQADSNGRMDITFLKLGSNFYHYFNAVVIEETNIAKP